MKEYISKKYEIAARLQLSGKHFEFWLPIKDFPSYEVSTEGRVRNVKTGKLLTPKKRDCFHLRRNGKNEGCKYIGRLVLETFVKSPYVTGKVMHIDGNRKNNSLSNLDYLQDERTDPSLEFKPIPKHEDYLVNARGDVFSTRYNRVLAIGHDTHGYNTVSLMYGDKGKRHGRNYHVHRLVAQTFIPNPNNFSVVNHINGIKTDNRVENLEWCTQKYNCEHASKKKLLQTGSSRYNAKLHEKYIPWIKKMRQAGISTPLIAKVYDVTPATILAVLNEKNWKQC